MPIIPFHARWHFNRRIGSRNGFGKTVDLVLYATENIAGNQTNEAMESWQILGNDISWN
jgi:hypothetical protein